MFSPYGYVSFESVSQLIQDWATRIYSAHHLNEMSLDHQTAFSETVSCEQVLSAVRWQRLTKELGDKPDFRSQAYRSLTSQMSMKDRFEISVIYHCIFSKVLVMLDTLVCSVDGQVMRPDKYVFLHLDRLDWVYPVWPLQRTNELIGIFELHEQRGFDGVDLAARYCFVDHALGMLRLKNNSASGFARCSHFGDDRHAEQFLKFQVEPFLDRSIVWSTESFPGNFATVLEEIGALDEDWNLSQISTLGQVSGSPGATRGSKPTGAKNEYFRRYPEGKPDGLSYEAIASELTEAGFPISGRQVLNYEKQRSQA
jgi:hypothetical protein